MFVLGAVVLGAVFLGPEFQRRMEIVEHNIPPGLNSRAGSAGKPLIVLLARSVWIEESEDLADRLLEHVGRQSPDAPRLSCAPIQALDLI